MNIIFIVSAIEPVSVLRIEFFSVRVDASANEEVRDLESMSFFAKLDTRFRELLRPLNRELCPVGFEDRLSEPVAVLNMESLVPRLDPAVIVVVRVCEYAEMPFKSTTIPTHAELVARHSVLVTEVLPVLSNPDDVTLALDPPEA